MLEEALQGDNGQRTQRLSGFARLTGVLILAVVRSVAMKLSGLYRFLVLAATGGMVFQTTTSCTTEFMNSLATSLPTAFSDALNAAITAYINQILSGTT
jgi:hypothetical protein